MSVLGGFPLYRSDVEDVPQPLDISCTIEKESVNLSTHEPPHITNSAELSSTVSVESVAPPPSKRKKSRVGDDVEELLVRNLKQLEERRGDDEEELFGRTVAATLRRLSQRQRAVAKMRIQTMLLDIEFPEEAYIQSQHTVYNHSL